MPPPNPRRACHCETSLARVVRESATDGLGAGIGPGRGHAEWRGCNRSVPGDNNKYFYGPATYGQTFKVGMAGSLTGVDLFMGAVSDTTVDVKIETLGRAQRIPCSRRT